MDFIRFPRIRTLRIGLALLIAMLHAQAATVLGTITHRNNKAATDVMVYIGDKWSYTGAKGRYRIDNVAPGRQRMQITTVGKQGSKKVVLLDVEVDVSNAVSTIDKTIP